MKDKIKLRKKILFITIAISVLIIGGFCCVLGINAYVKSFAKGKLYYQAENVPNKKVAVVLGTAKYIDGRRNLYYEYRLDAVAIRCWIEMQSQLGISPCVLLSEMNERGIPAACEVDVGNAVTMYALGCASGAATACLDWNNNYGDEDDACILFHCGPVPASMMRDKGKISDHLILANAVGEGHGFGCNVGHIAPGEFTFGSMVTDAGKLRFYLGYGSMTYDKVPDDFFGCAGVAEIRNLQDVLLHIGKRGYRHHVSVTPGVMHEPVKEALEHYLGFEVETPQEKS